MLVKILAVLAVIVGIFCYVASRQPDEFKVSRSIIIVAPPEAVFAEVNNLHHWQAWSPWVKLDPAATSSFAGPEEGMGASMSWSGNMKVGAGSMTIVESTAPNTVKFKLDFQKPIPGTSNAEFTFTPKGDKTEVVWSMYGSQNFINKAMGLILNCEKMVGEQFENGLAALKTVAEHKDAG